MNFCQEDAASILFGTAEPTAQEIGRAYVLARAVEANPDAWSLEELRAAHVLLSLVGDDYRYVEIVRYVEIARTFSYPITADARIAVVRYGRRILAATLIDVETITDFAERLSTNFGWLAPDVPAPLLTLTIVAPSADVEFHALQEAA